MTVLYVYLACDGEEFSVGEYLSMGERDKAIKLAEEKIVPLAKKYYKDVKVYTSHRDFCDWTNTMLLHKEFWKKHVNEKW